MSIGSGLLAAVLAATSATTAATTAGVVPARPLGAVVPWVRATGAGATGTGATGAGATGAGATDAGTAADRWAWPLDPRPEVTRRFDRPDQPWMPGHRGLDLVATVGQDVLAPTSGHVAWTGVIAGRSVVVISHEGGLRSTFEPVVATVPVGSAVTPGEPVGVMAATAGHCAPRTCLHWGVLRGESYLDPLSLVQRARVVLLPVP